MYRCPVYGTIPLRSSIDSGIFQLRYEREIIALKRVLWRKGTATLVERENE